MLNISAAPCAPMWTMTNNKLVKLVTIVCMCVLCIALSACTASSSATSTTKITDAYGRQVEVPKNASTAATVGSAARIVVYAGAADKLVAITDMDAQASALRPYTIVYAEQFSKLPSTSNGNHLNETSVDTEKLLSLHPDVIISSRSAQECDQLQQTLGIPVVGVSYQDEIFGKDLLSSILIVGEVLGTSNHAKGVVEKISDWEKDLQTRTSSIADNKKPSAYAGAVNYKGAKGITGTYGSFSVFNAASIKNVADEKGITGWFETDLEQIGAWNPDYLFLNPANKTILSQEYAQNTSFLSSLKAVQQNQVYSLPAFNFNGTNVELGICGAYFCGATVYPEQFASVSLSETYNEILEVLIGAPCYEQLSEKGIVFGSFDIAAGA